MKTLEEIKGTPHLLFMGPKAGFEQKHEVYHGQVSWDDLKFRGSVVFGFNENGIMEHVSVSSFSRAQLPSWEVMCRLKDMFWNKDEMVVQIHPAESRYVHGVLGLENVLHLWRPKDGDFKLLNHPELWD